MRQANCMICQQSLLIAEDARKSGGFTGVCDPCKLTYLLVFKKDNTYYIQNVQRRFSSKNQTWHLCYRPKLDESTFILIEKGRGIFWQGEGSKPRLEYKIEGFVQPERFTSLLPFI